MHRLSPSFVLGYHGCESEVGERLLNGESPRKSENTYDWLGSGVYFWEANPRRGLQFAATKRGKPIQNPMVVGAIIDLGLCLDLTTLASVEWVRIAHASLVDLVHSTGGKLSENSEDGLKRNLDRAVIQHLHVLLDELGRPAIDSIRGIFTEGDPIYPGSGFREKTHVQIAVCNLVCIKGFFRVPKAELENVVLTG